MDLAFKCSRALLYISDQFSFFVLLRFLPCLTLKFMRNHYCAEMLPPVKKIIALRLQSRAH